MNPIATLFLLALPIACVSWTITHEEVFREPREYCKERCQPHHKPIVKRKFYYLFTCEYCFSHYVTLFVLFLTAFKLPFTGTLVDYPLTGFALVWIANLYMGIHFRLRLLIKKIGAEAKLADAKAKEL